MRPTKLTEKDYRDIIKLKNMGVSVARIARDYNVTAVTVWRLLKKYSSK